MSSSELFKTKECALTSHVINLKEKEDSTLERPLDSRTRTTTSTRFDVKFFRVFSKYRLHGELYFTKKVSTVTFSEEGYALFLSQNDKTSSNIDILFLLPRHSR